MPMQNKAPDVIFDDNATPEELQQRAEQLEKYFKEENSDDKVPPFKLHPKLLETIKEK